MSAEIIQFVPRPNRRRHLSGSSAKTRSIFGEDDLAMDHADTAPCDYVMSGSSQVREDGEWTG
jgi:hypothetical protein